MRVCAPSPASAKPLGFSSVGAALVYVFILSGAAADSPPAFRRPQSTPSIDVPVFSGSVAWSILARLLRHKSGDTYGLQLDRIPNTRRGYTPGGNYYITAIVVFGFFPAYITVCGYSNN